MRLTPHEVRAIKAAARLAFGPDAVVRLFGSRVRDDARGGDIDLHVETPSVVDSGQLTVDFLDRLFVRIEPQRVDVLHSVRGAPLSGIERIAYRDGVPL